VYKNTVVTVKRQIQKVENPTPATVNSTEAVSVYNVILVDYLTTEVALQEPEIGSTEPNIPINNNCWDAELHLRMPGGCEDYNDEDYKIDGSDAIITPKWRRQAATELERFDLGTSDVDRY
jgi:hypothetical protein